ncbi:unnamed protein product [Paramecium primaurelia]|uniref:Uncharacterized protein n=1 Tax=Paramecium primaurelia TaxID=5886 RepID=A0A8S1QET0_PARPR|nr:unnamed protein product [Paramecium primaurelia]
MVYELKQLMDLLIEIKQKQQQLYIQYLLNNNEDLIISGSCDFTIRFYKKQNQWLCQQTITDHTSHVQGLNMNQHQNKVISCGREEQILIIEQSQQDTK